MSLDEETLDVGKDMLRLLNHATGNGKRDRNYYAAPRNSAALSEWSLLVGLGLAVQHIERSEGIVFHVAPAGLAFLHALETSDVK